MARAASPNCFHHSVSYSHPVGRRARLGQGGDAGALDGAPAPDGDLLAHDLPALGIAGDQPKEPR